MGQLFDLVGDLPDTAIAGALGLQVALEMLEPLRKSSHQGTELAEFGHVAGAAPQGGSGRRHLATADFGNGAAQRVMLVAHGQLVALAETVHSALDGAQGLAAADGGLRTHDLIAQVADPAGNAGQCGLSLFDMGIATLDLIEQRDQLAPQGMPLTRLRFVSRIGHIRIWEGAGHI